MSSSRRYNCDIVVIGGGPAGLTAARVAAEAGLHILVLEEHPEIGRPVSCTGLLSPAGLQEAGISPDDSRIVLHPIRGGFIHAPDGFRLEIKAPEPRAYVLDRVAFDRELAHQALEAGVEIRTGVRIAQLELDHGVCLRVRRAGEEASISAEVLIGADGAKGWVARQLGLGAARELIYGLQAEVEYSLEREDHVEVFFGEEVAPGFFAWAVPTAPGRARLGLGTVHKRQVRELFARLLQRCGEPPLEVHGGVIPLGPPERTVADRVLLVGDAAAQAKPTSGGGIYTGMACARIAGEVAAAAIKRDDTSAVRLAEYEQRWRAAIGRELELGLLARKIFLSLSDADLNRIFRGLADPEILRIIAEHGDIDHPSLVLKELIRRPRIWRRLLRLLPARAGLKPLLESLLMKLEIAMGRV